MDSRLTLRKTVVVRLTVEGLSNREIVGQLGLTEHTVKNYLFRIFDKLGVNKRVGLVHPCLRQEQHARRKLAAGGGFTRGRTDDGVKIRNAIGFPA